MPILDALPELEIPQKSTSDGLRLKEVHLPAGPVAGFDVEWGHKTGNKTKYYLEGYDGIRFIGAGRDFTHVVPKLEDSETWDSTVFIGPTAKRVEFEGITFHGGPRKAIHYGVEYNPVYTPLTITFNRCRIRADEPGEFPWTPPAGGLGNTSVWGLTGYNAAVFCFQVEFEWGRGAEHPFYGRGITPPGILFDQCDWISSGGECIKVATRPGAPGETPESWWHPGTILVQDCTFRDWGPQPWSWRGGGGTGLQGTGCNIHFLRCIFLGGPGASKSRAFMVDDGGVPRFYSAIDGTPGKGPANGWTILQESLLVGDGLDSWGILARAGTLTPGSLEPVCRGLGVFGCGLYSRANTGISKLEIGRIMDGNIVIEGCNTPEIRAVAEAWVTELGPEAMVTGPMGSFPASKDYRGGIFAKASPTPA